MAAAVGYLRSEFLALGVDFDERNDLFDESIEVMRGVWSEVAFGYAGRHFTSRAQTALPFPVQGEGIPIWIAGNSRRARERGHHRAGMGASTHRQRNSRNCTDCAASDTY